MAILLDETGQPLLDELGQPLLDELLEAFATASISPASIVAGSAGQTLTLIGEGFADGATVRWEGKSLATTRVDDVTLTAVVPAVDLAVAGLMAVTVAGQVAALSLVEPLPGAPVPTGLTPADMPAGSPDFTLAVTGTNFAPGQVVRFNGHRRATTYIGPARLEATILAADVAAYGMAWITVT